MATKSKPAAAAKDQKQAATPEPEFFESEIGTVVKCEDRPGWLISVYVKDLNPSVARNKIDTLLYRRRRAPNVRAMVEKRASEITTLSDFSDQ